jgi:hyperosmotically inducible periplasmic protein
MRQFKLLTLSMVLALGTVVGCAHTDAKSPDVGRSIQDSLDQAGLRDIHVNQDRDKGVVTLTGQVPSNDDKQRAEAIAKSIATGQVVSNEVGVVPPRDNDAKTINSDLDKAIAKNLDAALIQNGLNKAVKYDVNNGVITLKGKVNSSSKRFAAQHIAASIPNVQQVVNELDVRDQKATSSN